MDLMHSLIDLVLHLDTHLNALVAQLGGFFYGILFLIIFAETGLVVTPFLPGDSLLFAVGALAAISGSSLELHWLALVCFGAALCGDVTNYTVGRNFGPKLFRSDSSKLFNRNHLRETEAFYRKHGGKTIIIARFLPIIRTFAPFVAGIGQMHFTRFISFSIVGATLWIVPFIGGGYWLGNNPAIKANFHYVVFVIIGISLAPAVIQVLRTRRTSAAESINS